MKVKKIEVNIKSANKTIVTLVKPVNLCHCPESI